jgi:glycine reductase
MTQLAETVGVIRIVKGKAVTHPFGDPTVSTAEELAYRRQVVERALAAASAQVDGPTVFEA